ncbi:MAG: hypothetical protein ACTSQJ_09505 [Promethearchaeota archaeon]
MPKEFRGVIISRFIILISIITVPIIIFLIFNLTNFDLWFSSDPILQFWIIRILCPLVYSISWLFFLILFANRFSSTIDTMDRTVGVVPLRLKFFYGINAIFVLFIFVFPLITPIIAILSFASIAWRLTTLKKESWEDSETSFLTKFVMILFASLPIFCTICIIPDYLTLPLFLWFNLWLPLLNLIFIVSYCLCTALAIGSLLILISNSGISEYEQIFINSEDKPNLTHIRITELFLFLFLLYLALNEFAIVHFFYILGFILLLFVSIINFFQGRSKNRNFKGHLLGYLLAAVFMGSDLFFTFISAEFSEFLKIWSLLISAIVFIYIFFYTFVVIEESEF